MTNPIENLPLKLAFDFVQYTNKNIFLTGKAGTGKTTFLRNLKKVSPKRMIVVAPTGVAAINAGGVTIHSFFQLPFGPFIASQNSEGEHENNSRKTYQKFSKDKINIIRSLDLLVIDEISMVRADLLDGIDDVLRRYKDKFKPFGGVQLLMIGDIQQLSPVAKEEEWSILQQWYESPYFFNSRALLQTSYVSVELKHVYRQSDSFFINLLNKVRENNIDEETLGELNKRYNPKLAQNTPEGYIILTTHNHQAQRINEQKLVQLNNKAFQFKADTQGEFPDYIFPTDYSLTLKKGAQVMFVKNDISREKLYYNGKIGIIEQIDSNTIHVKCPNDDTRIAVSRVEWQNIKYTINEDTKEIQENVAGTFIQYPLKLAWAITIHKSQGLTFERAIIDASSAFAHGQVYVALSRCKTLEGMVLSSQLSRSSIINDANVQSFSRDIELNQPGTAILEQSKQEYQQSLILELFDFSQNKRQLGYCYRLYRENIGSLHEGFKDALDRMSACINTDLVEVSDKFKPQIVQLLSIEPDVAKNEALNERITKGSKYFTEKIETGILKILQGASVESDNKKIKKTISDVLEKIEEDLIIRMACFSACSVGFDVKTFLDVRAKTLIEKSLEKPSGKTSKKTSKKSGKNISVIEDEEISTTALSHPELVISLKKWRTKTSQHIGQPAFVVMHQKSLLDIAQQLPTTLKQLGLINGIGKQKIKTFGMEILDIVTQYCAENCLEKNKPTDIDEKIEKIEKDGLFRNDKQPKKELKIDTRMLSFELFNQGKSINEIATERNLKAITIENHLADFVFDGKINIFEIVDNAKLNRIECVFNMLGTSLLKPVKEELGDDFSYTEIKMVQAYILRNEAAQRALS